MVLGVSCSLKGSNENQSRFGGNMCKVRDFLTHPPRLFQGTGRYAIYIANYASGNVGPHALIEMDDSASDLSQGVIALSNVAEQAGVNKFTGGCERRCTCG